MKKENAKRMITFLALALAGCAGNNTAGEAANGFKTVDQLSSKDCSAAEAGSLLLEKASGTMYACTDGNWLPLNSGLSCETKESDDGASLAIVCNGATIGTVKNGAQGENCQVVGEPTIDSSNTLMTVTIKCGADETKVEIPFQSVSQTVYQKHVVVRFPVRSEKVTNSGAIYEEIWSSLRITDHSELTILDLDSRLKSTGRIYNAELVESAAQPFVTVEEYNNKEVRYNVVRLEGDFTVTDLSSSIVQLRVKLNIGSNNNRVELVYNAIADLASAADTLVIDFLTDYKAARAQHLAETEEFSASAALVKANAELAAALDLTSSPEEYPVLENYLPNKIGLNEHFNSVFWIMALFDQSSLVGDIKQVYEDYRAQFAADGSFNRAITTTFAGRELSLFFVDYLALLINVNFDKYNTCGGWCWNYNYNGFQSRYSDINYKIIQHGFESTYQLSKEKLINYGNIDFQKSSVPGGYFRYFYYDDEEKIWQPVPVRSQFFQYIGSFAEKGDCSSDNDGAIATFSSEGYDFSAKCADYAGHHNYYWDIADVCTGRALGDKGFTLDDNGDDFNYICVKEDPDCIESAAPGAAVTTCLLITEAYLPDVMVQPIDPGLSDDELIAEALGTCDETVMKDPTKNLQPLDLRELMLSTTTGYAYYKCDYVQRSGSKKYLWVEADNGDIAFALVCNESIIHKVIKIDDTDYVCSDIILNGEYAHAWSKATTGQIVAGEVCYTDRKNEIITKGENDVYCNGQTWQPVDVNAYCRNNVKIDGTLTNNVFATEQLIADENLGSKTFSKKCQYDNKLYVTNSEITDSTAWKSAEDYIKIVYGTGSSSLPQGYYIFMDGYKERAVYFCQDSCVESSLKTIRDLDPSAENALITLQEKINIIANMSTYQKASGYVGNITFEADVVTSNESNETITLVAAAARTDWHEPTPSELGDASSDGN